MLNTGQNEITSIYQSYSVFSLLFSQKSQQSTIQLLRKSCPEISYQILALKVPVLKRYKATNSSTSTELSCNKTLVLGNLFKSERDLPSHSHGYLPLGIMKRVRRLSYFLHLYPQVANFPCECDVKSKNLE